MKFNNKELFEVYSMPADLEGRLQHKRAHKTGLCISGSMVPLEMKKAKCIEFY